MIEVLPTVAAILAVAGVEAYAIHRGYNGRLALAMGLILGSLGGATVARLWPA